jgi:hypothetical protein
MVIGYVHAHAIARTAGIVCIIPVEINVSSVVIWIR